MPLGNWAPAAMARKADPVEQLRQKDHAQQIHAVRFHTVPGEDGEVSVSGKARSDAPNGAIDGSIDAQQRVAVAQLVQRVVGLAPVPEIVSGGYPTLIRPDGRQCPNQGQPGIG